MAHRLKVPYPIVLVLAGLVISFVPHMPRIPLDPNLVFLIFLPPLLYAAAWTTSWREFRHNLVLISLLAVGLVGFTVWGVAEFSEHFITALDWKAGFLLGAVVATTDAIAATSIAQIDRAAAKDRRHSGGREPAERCDRPAGAGAWAEHHHAGRDADGRRRDAAAALSDCGRVGIGLLIGVVVGWLEKFIDDGPVEMVVSLVVPYAAYLAGEQAQASGVLAVVACGLYLSRKSATFFSPAVRIAGDGRVGCVDVHSERPGVCADRAATAVCAGGDSRAYGMATLVEYGAVFSVMLIVLRMVWVFPAVKMASLLRRWTGHAEKQPGAARRLCDWVDGDARRDGAGGGDLGSGDAGRMEAPFGPRNLIVFLAFCVILVTLVLQGLTLPSLIRALGLAGATGMSAEEREARKIALEEAIAYLEEGTEASRRRFLSCVRRSAGSVSAPAGGG